MLLKDISFDLPEENILFDEALFSLAEEGLSAETLRFWESQKTFVVLGRTSQLQADVYFEICQKEGIPILRRCSGGGTVVQGKGCLNFVCIISKSRHPLLADIRKSYHYILEKVTQSLEQIQVKASFRPVSDLVFGSEDKKFSGNAQRRGRKYILHHGTILYDFDLQSVERYLKMPGHVPDYRQGRSHLNFIKNIPLKTEEFKQSLSVAFSADVREDFLNTAEQKYLKRLLEDRKYCVEWPKK